MTIKPLGNRILVKRLNADEITRGGIIIPETAKERPKEGLIVAVGDTVLDEVAIGDVILFEDFAGDPLDVDGAPHLLMFEDEMIAVVS